MWPGAVCGNDRYGHVVYCERFCEMKSKELLARFSLDEILQHRAQVHEAIQRRQLEIACERGEVRRDGVCVSVRTHRGGRTVGL